MNREFFGLPRSWQHVDHNNSDAIDGMKQNAEKEKEMQDADSRMVQVGHDGVEKLRPKAGRPYMQNVQPQKNEDTKAGQAV